MIRLARGCLGTLILGLLLLGVAWAGWRWGDHLFPRLWGWLDGGAAAASVEPGPELARSTLERVEALRRGAEGGSGELRLGPAAVASVLRYGAPGVLPPGVAPPGVELEAGRVRLSSRIAVADVPPLPELEGILGILPDTVPVSVDASLMPFGEAGAALVVHRIHASGVPLPRRVVPRILESLGREDRPGLPPDALQVPLPAGVRSAYILGDSLVLVASR